MNTGFDFDVLLKNLNAMRAVMDSEAGRPFRIDGKLLDSLSILERRAPEGDLKAALGSYNRIFTKGDDTTIEDICSSFCAFFRIKTLAENRALDFNSDLMQVLYDEYAEQTASSNKMVKLIRMQGETADSSTKESILAKIEKYDAFAARCKKEMEEINRLFDKPGKPEDAMPVSKTEEDRTDNFSEEIPSSLKNHPKNMTYPVKTNVPKEKRGLFSPFLAKKPETGIKKDFSLCRERPVKEKSLPFSEYSPCRDMPNGCLLKSKGRIYFGLLRNVNENTYINTDNSLFWLSRANEDFYSFMTLDLLNGDYEIRPFTKEEKAGLLLYLDFMEKTPGALEFTGYTQSDRQRFLSYYNSLVQKVCELEDMERTRKNLSLILAERYLSYTSSYNVNSKKDQKAISEDLLMGNAEPYLESLSSIINEYISEPCQQKLFLDLSDKINEAAGK